MAKGSTFSDTNLRISNMQNLDFSRRTGKCSPPRSLRRMALYENKVEHSVFFKLKLFEIYTFKCGQ